MRKQQIAILALFLWLTIVSVLMLLAQQLNPEIFFVLFLIGFLVIKHLIEPNFVQPGYMRYLLYLTAAGIVIFGAIVIKKVIEILAK